MPKSSKGTNVTATLTQVAKLYYNDGLSHQEIAQKLSVSRSLITQYLKKAKDQGIVQIEIVEPESHHEELIKKIKSKTTLKHLKIISQAHNSDELTRKAVSSAGLELVQELAKDKMVLGLALGRNVIDMVEGAGDLTPRAMRLLPLFGESSAHNQYNQINHTVMTLAKAFNCEANFLHAPMMVDSEELKETLMRDATIKKVCALWKVLDLSIMGIGAIPQTAGMVPFISKKEMDTLRRDGAVGDICGHYYDIEGELLPSNHDSRLIGATVKQLKRCPQNIALTYGSDKARAVVGALKTKILNGLVIDQSCAEEVADML